jgi:hypothetical protein
LDRLYFKLQKKEKLQQTKSFWYDALRIGGLCVFNRRNNLMLLIVLIIWYLCCFNNLSLFNSMEMYGSRWAFSLLNKIKEMFSANISNFFMQIN